VSRGRILFFADASHVHTRRWVQAAAERRFDCVVATRLAGTIDGAADVITIQPGRDTRGWFRALPEVRALAERLAPQWIHGHYVTSYGMWAAACRHIAPVVLTAWGSDVLVTPRERSWRGRLVRALLGWTLKRADLITADARDVLDEIARYGALAPLHEVLWGVDTRRFRPTEAMRVDDTRFELISARQWEPNYRIDLVLRAFAALRVARPALRTRLTLLGDGSGAAALRALSKQLALDDEVVRFVGRVDDAGMVAALQRSDVAVSVPASDATSVAMLESMACALAVVASDLTANRPWIDVAQRVPVDDLEALTAALLELADDPAQRRAIGRRNRETVVQRASRDEHMDRMAVMYESLHDSSRESVT
jgi:glycosyltransferase involved in cell wall biosynthesis